MSVLVNVKKTATGSLQGELHDTVEKPGAVNVLSLLNSGDKRFVRNMRRAWFPVTAISLEKIGVSKEQIEQINKLPDGDIVILNINDPKIDGNLLRIQVVESTTPDVWQRQNAFKAAKHIMIDEKTAKSRVNTEYDLGKYLNQNGYFLDEEGNFIYTKTVVTIENQISHTFIQGTLVPETELPNYGATLAATPEPKDQEEVEKELQKEAV